MLSEDAMQRIVRKVKIRDARRRVEHCFDERGIQSSWCGIQDDWQAARQLRLVVCANPDGRPWQRAVFDKYVRPHLPLPILRVPTRHCWVLRTVEDVMADRPEDFPVPPKQFMERQDAETKRASGSQERWQRGVPDRGQPPDTDKRG